MNNTLLMACEYHCPQVVTTSMKTRGCRLVWSGIDLLRQDDTPATEMRKHNSPKVFHITSYFYLNHLLGRS